MNFLGSKYGESCLATNFTEFIEYTKQVDPETSTNSCEFQMRVILLKPFLYYYFYNLMSFMKILINSRFLWAGFGPEIASTWILVSIQYYEKVFGYKILLSQGYTLCLPMHKTYSQKHENGLFLTEMFLGNINNGCQGRSIRGGWGVIDPEQSRLPPKENLPLGKSGEGRSILPILPPPRNFDLPPLISCSRYVPDG